MSSLRIILLASVCLTLSACDRYVQDRYLVRKDSIAFNAGDSIAWNSAVQIPDPWPRYSNDPNIAFDGQKSTLAVKRYRADKEFLSHEWATEQKEIGPGVETGAGASAGAGPSMGVGPSMGAAPPGGQGY